MRKFVLEVFAFFILLILTINVLYRINKPYRLKRLEELKGKIEIVNLGTSHGWDFEYSRSPLIGMNFNISGNTLFYDLQNHRFLSEGGYLADKAIVIIPVSYFVFGLDENRTDGKVGDSFANQFYEYLPRKSIYSYSLKKEIELYIYKVQKNFQRLIDKKNKKNNTPNQAHVQENNELKAKRLEELADKRVKRHLELSKYASESKNMEYLEILISEILAADHQVVLVTTPYYCAYTENFGKEWLDKNYFARMNHLAVKFNIAYLDYSNDKRFVYSPDLFSDSDHLNPKGREIFNEIFFEDIAEIIDETKTQQ